MTVNKRSKFSRYSGSKTHGCGSKKKRRGAGHRGGRGLAGTGKRADSKKPSIWANKKYFGRHGFVNKNANTIKSINTKDLNSLINKFNEGKYKDSITFDNDIYTIDLTKMGFDKLLGKGIIESKVKVVVENMTEAAKKKLVAE